MGSFYVVKYSVHWMIWIAIIDTHHSHFTLLHDLLITRLLFCYTDFSSRVSQRDPWFASTKRAHGSTYRIHFNRSCSVQVHVSFGKKECSPDVLQNLVATAWTFETPLSDIYPPKCTENIWCSTLRSESFLDVKLKDYYNKVRPVLQYPVQEGLISWRSSTLRVRKL